MVLGAILAGIAALAAVSAAVFCQRCASLAARGAPKALADGHQAVVERLLAVEGESASVRANMVSWVAEITGIMESVEGCLAQIETKRRKTSAAAAKIDRDNGGAEPDPSTMTRAQLQQLARERGVY